MTQLTAWSMEEGLTMFGKQCVLQSTPVNQVIRTGNTVHMDRNNIKAYVLGSGIASLASAAYLIKDGNVPGANITILEELGVLGGGLDGESSSEHQYVVRNGRTVTDEACACMFDLLSFVPSLSAPGKSVKDEIVDYTDRVRVNPRASIVRGGSRSDASTRGLTNKHRLDIIRLMSSSDDVLADKKIEQLFDPTFFSSNFWYTWCTTLAFQPWDDAAKFKEYLLNFIQDFPNIHTLGGVWRTPFNQYDSIVLPLAEWLAANGVQIILDAQVTELNFALTARGKSVSRIHCRCDGNSYDLQVDPDDLVVVANGSMTASSSLGSMALPPALGIRDEGGSWALWESMARGNTDFGNPSAFIGNPEKSNWTSFTMSLRDPAFFNLVERSTGDKAGTGGLVTLVDSSWRMSVVLPHQPYFTSHPDDTFAIWGYALRPDLIGNFLKKEMADCTGEEILKELCHHLNIEDYLPRILHTTVCIPSAMTALSFPLMPYAKGSRAPIRPSGTTNIAFVGPFSELTDDAVFTVEYSVKSAQSAVYSLLDMSADKIAPCGHRQSMKMSINFG